MNARTANRLLLILALAGIAGCSDVQPVAPLAPTLNARFATIAGVNDRTYPTLGVPTTYSVSGPFSDVIRFTVSKAGTYRVTVIGNTLTVGCSGRYCRSPGTLKATLSRVELQKEDGTLLTKVAGSTTVHLDPGTSLLVVDGKGVGTGRYAGTGTYTVTVMMPVVVVPTCDAVRGELQALGYSGAAIDARIAELLAMSPPGCSDD